MSDRLPRVTAAEVIGALQRNGFLLARQSGSHKIYKNDRGKRCTVPDHAGKTLHPKALRNILRDADWTIETFRAFLSS